MRTKRKGRLYLRIAEIRKEHGLTQTALAGILQIPRNTLCQYETGARAVPAALLPAIAAALGCTIEDLYKQN